MLKREREILAWFKMNRMINASDLPNVFRKEHDLSTIYKLCSNGLLENDGVVVRLTKVGYDTAKEFSEKKARERKQNRAKEIEKREERRYNLKHDCFILIISSAISGIFEFHAELGNLILKLSEVIASFFH